MRYYYFAGLILALLLVPQQIVAKEQVHFVMFGPNISEDKIEVLSGLEPFVNWLNARLTFDLVPHFFKNKARMNAFLNNHKVSFALLDMSYFLEKKKKYGFVPILKPVVKNRDNYQIVIVARKKSSYQKISNLQNQIVSTVSPYSGTYRVYSKIVFKGKINVSTYFKLHYARQAYPAMIDVLNKQAAAAIVWRKDFESMCEINPAARRDLQVIFKSEALPFHPLVVLKKNVNDEKIKTLTKELFAQAQSAEGRQLLSVFKYDGWSHADSEEYQALYKRYFASPINKKQ